MTLCPTGKKSGVSGPDQSVKCVVVLNVSCKRSWCTVELCPAWPMWNHVEQRPVTLHPVHSPPPPPSLATGDSGYLQLPRGMDQDRAHLVNLRAAKSGICGYRTVYVHIVLYFSSINTVYWNTSRKVYPCSIDWCYYIGLINHTME
jgi:hypothetical protein